MPAWAQLISYFLPYTYSTQWLVSSARSSHISLRLWSRWPSFQKLIPLLLQMNYILIKESPFIVAYIWKMLSVNFRVSKLESSLKSNSYCLYQYQFECADNAKKYFSLLKGWPKMFWYIWFPVQIDRRVSQWLQKALGKAFPCSAFIFWLAWRCLV